VKAGGAWKPELNMGVWKFQSAPAGEGGRCEENMIPTAVEAQVSIRARR
jgi:hypothetical protein